MLSGDNISSFATDGGGCGDGCALQSGPGLGAGGRCRTSRRTSDASSSAVTGMRGCFVSPEAMRFTTNFDLVRISIAVRASCTSESGRGLGVSAGCSPLARRRRLAGFRPSRASVHSVPQPRFSVNRTPVRRANQTSKKKYCEIVHQRVPTRGDGCIRGARRAGPRGRSDSQGNTVV